MFNLVYNFKPNCIYFTMLGKIYQYFLCHSTHVKISKLGSGLQTNRQQVVFAWLVPSCQQVWNKLLTTCNNLVDIVRLVTRLFQQGCYNHDVTILLQPSDANLVTSLIMPSSLLHVVNNLLQTCYNKLGTSSANTTC